MESTYNLFPFDFFCSRGHDLSLPSQDLVCFGAAISACEKASQWEYALGLLEQLLQAELLPNTVICNALVSTCEPWPWIARGVSADSHGSFQADSCAVERCCIWDGARPTQWSDDSSVTLDFEVAPFLHTGHESKHFTNADVDTPKGERLGHSSSHVR